MFPLSLVQKGTNSIHPLNFINYFIFYKAVFFSVKMLSEHEMHLLYQYEVLQRLTGEDSKPSDSFSGNITSLYTPSLTTSKSKDSLWLFTTREDELSTRNWQICSKYGLSLASSHQHAVSFNVCQRVVSLTSHELFDIFLMYLCAVRA